MNSLRHPLDLDLSEESELDLFVEELPEQVLFASDCLGTASTFSTKGCLGSFSSVGSIISTGGPDPRPPKVARAMKRTAKSLAASGAKRDVVRDVPPG